jgi:hypothetical protein
MCWHRKGSILRLLLLFTHCYSVAIFPEMVIHNHLKLGVSYGSAQGLSSNDIVHYCFNAWSIKSNATLR